MNTFTVVERPAEVSRILNLVVKQIRFEAVGINSYELVDPEGGDLPEVTAGAHIDVHLKNGMTRQYSLSNDPRERHRYVFAVLKDEGGRGGSKTLHQTLHVQDIVKIGYPRNNFLLDESAKRYILLAGGIGITPLKAMCHRLERIGAPYTLYYCSKAPENTVFREELTALGPHGEVVFHHDRGDFSRSLDISALLAEPEEGTQVYYCGPTGFMKACAAATAHWPEGSVHYEHFNAPAPKARADSESGAALSVFEIEIASTGQIVMVSAGQTIVEALADAGMKVETSCSAGLCGACKIRYLAGEPDHQDFILSAEDKEKYLTACVSRSRTKTLLLDL